MGTVEKILYNATLVFPVTSTHVWMAVKKRSIGANLLNGVGGGIENGETPEQCAVREANEEWGLVVLPHCLRKRAVVDFHNTTADGETFICRIHVFLVTDWAGDLHESPEMGMPRKFSRQRLPIESMMPADKD